MVFRHGYQNILSAKEPIFFQPTRNTFILKRRWPVRLHGKNQRPHALRGKNFVYDLVEDRSIKKRPNIELILTAFVSGIGDKGEVVSLRRSEAYNRLLLPGLAVYKTEENLAKYANDAKTNVDKESLFSSPHAQRTLNVLEKRILAVIMNKDHPWVLEPWHIRVSLRKAGMYANDHNIEIPKEPITGPDLLKESKEFIVTVTINNKEKAKIRCRIHHWSTNPNMEKEVIEAVLRANQGAVDATIDQLLAMSVDNQNEKLRNEMDKTGSTPNKCVLNSTKESEISAESGSSLLRPTASATVTNTGASPKVKKPSLNSSNNSSPLKNSDRNTTKSNKKWNPPMLGPLPPGFLRLSGCEPRADYDIPDEQFALMLNEHFQNEEFMNELRWNQEFMLALEKEQQDKGGEDDIVFRERLKHMGKKSRKKFLQLARVFTWQRNKKKAGAVRHPDSLLLQEEHSDDEEPRKTKKFM
ncbi:39S ribosomal protein L9, mitochondrial, partial [Pseudolycoriella hygida]